MRRERRGKTKTPRGTKKKGKTKKRCPATQNKKNCKRPTYPNQLKGPQKEQPKRDGAKNGLNLGEKKKDQLGSRNQNEPRFPRLGVGCSTPGGGKNPKKKKEKKKGKHKLAQQKTDTKHMPLKKKQQSWST